MASGTRVGANVQVSAHAGQLCASAVVLRGDACLFRGLLRARTARAAVAGATVARRPADVSSRRTSSGKPSAACRPNVHGPDCLTATRAVRTAHSVTAAIIKAGTGQHRAISSWVVIVGNIDVAIT